MKVLIATHNKQKLSRYRRMLTRMPDLELLSLDDLGIAEKAEENHLSNVENAKHKARFYGSLSGLITLGIDEAVMTNFLPDNEQPGVYVRRFSGDRKELSDDEVIEVWKEIFKKYPEEDKRFIFDFAVAYFNPKNESMDCVTVEQISYVASHFSDMESEGYPLSRLLTIEKGGCPYVELSQEDKWNSDEINFASFLNSFSDWLDSQK